jgi:hypothetical protein
VVNGLRQRLEALEQRIGKLPDTLLIDRSFSSRAFAVVGHHFVGSLYLSLLLGLFLLLVRGCQ